MTTDTNAIADRIVRNDVHLCLSSMVSTLAGGAHQVPHRDRDDSALFDLTQQAAELSAPVLDYEEAAREAGWTQVSPGALWTIADGRESGFTAESAAEACEIDGIEPHEWDVYEHWAVSSWLAEKLTAAGERVDTDFSGLNVWARTTTGQAISMDAVIQGIARDLEAAR